MRASIRLVSLFTIKLPPWVKMARASPPAHSRAPASRPDRVLHRESLECHAADGEQRARLDNASVFDGITVNQRPGLLGGVDRAWRAGGKPKGVVRVGVGEDDGGGRDVAERLEPIGDTIDHDAGP